MSTENDKLDKHSDSTEPTEEVLVACYEEATKLLRAKTEADEAWKSFKKGLEKHGIGPEFIEFVMLRRKGSITSRLSKASKLRRLAARFGEEVGDQQSLFGDSLSEKSREALKLNDVAEEGYAAGLEGVSTDGCPYPAGSEYDDTWRRNHASAREFMLRSGQTTADETPAEVRPRKTSLRAVA